MRHIFIFILFIFSTEFRTTMCLCKVCWLAGEISGHFVSVPAICKRKVAGKIEGKNELRRQQTKFNNTNQTGV